MDYTGLPPTGRAPMDPEKPTSVTEWAAGHDMSKTNPPHYTKGRLIEPIAVVDDWNLSFCLGSALKYIARAGRKTGEPAEADLAKAIWYLTHELEQLEKKATKANVSANLPVRGDAHNRLDPDPLP